MLLNPFLRAHNFTQHPFDKVAAEKEELLELYFIPPRYFSEVLGDAKYPKSYVVFGPRGGGKSAIRAMIERYCNSNANEEYLGGNVFCITYDDFSTLPLHKLNTITLSDHINEILKRGVPKLASELVDRELVGEDSKPEYRGLLRWYIDEYLSDLSKLELDNVLKILQSKSEKIKGLLKDAVDLYNTILSVLKLERIEPTKLSDTPKTKRDSISSIHIMEVFIRLVTEVGFDSVYILVDKIDETEYTSSDSNKAAKLVHPMITNMKLLELDKCAFKFFLWENVRSYFGAELREDRITMKSTKWSDTELELMLQERIKAYSLNRTVFEKLFDSETSQKFMKIVLSLSYKSPRDQSRLMEAIFAEAAPLATNENTKISWNSVKEGCNRFCNQRSKELYTPDTIERILRLNKIEFTIPEVAATYKITGDNFADESEAKSATNRARNLVDKWKNTGIIQQIDSISTTNRGGRRRVVSQYAIIDPRIIYLADAQKFFEKFQ